MAGSIKRERFLFLVKLIENNCAKVVINLLEIIFMSVDCISFNNLRTRSISPVSKFTQACL